MKRPPSSRWWLLGAGFVACAVLLALVVRAELRSIERGSRFFRSGEYSDAASLFRQHLERQQDAQLLHYNLGTSLLYLGAEGEARDELNEALAGSDSTVAYRAHYNLGYHFLSNAHSHHDQDTAEVFARGAITMSRRALRLDPGSEDARWNLALAQRTLDSLLWLAAGVNEELVRDSLLAAEMQDMAPLLLREMQDGLGSLGGHMFTRGEREALARDLDGPLAGADLDAAGAGSDQSAAQLLRRIFLVRSPNRWGSLGRGIGRTW